MMSRKEFNRAYAPSKPLKPKGYGVFVWDGKGMYQEKDAIKVYKIESAAMKFADANIDKNYVVRQIW